jgi:hypothetical protein
MGAATAGAVRPAWRPGTAAAGTGGGWCDRAPSRVPAPGRAARAANRPAEPAAHYDDVRCHRIPDMRHLAIRLRCWSAFFSAGRTCRSTKPGIAIRPSHPPHHQQSPGIPAQTPDRLAIRTPTRPKVGSLGHAYAPEGRRAESLRPTVGAPNPLPPHRAAGRTFLPAPVENGSSVELQPGLTGRAELIVGEQHTAAARRQRTRCTCSRRQ